MNILFIVYHDLKTEARSQEILRTMEKMGTVTVVSYADGIPNENARFISNKNDKRSLLPFLINARRAIESTRPDVVVLHDDYPMILLPYIRKRCPNCIIIHDSSELRLVSEKKKNLSPKEELAFCFRYIERKYSGQADIVIAANKERALIMQTNWHLKKPPIVFDNMHRIDTEYNKEECEKKFGKYFQDGQFTALYAGGISEQRMTFQILEQIGKLGLEYQLLVLGMARETAKAKFDQIAKTKRIMNAKYLGFVTREELKYLLSRCDVNISAFAMDTVNNINCASGKVYEGLFLGKPLLSGLNPPLKSLCEEYGVGVSTDDFGAGLVRIREQYSEYTKNVHNYIETIDYDHRLEHLQTQLETEIHVIKNCKE